MEINEAIEFLQHLCDEYCWYNETHIQERGCHRSEFEEAENERKQAKDNTKLVIELLKSLDRGNNGES